MGWHTIQKGVYYKYSKKETWFLFRPAEETELKFYVLRSFFTVHKNTTKAELDG